MANPEPPRRRFAPVPIETTFQSVRKSNVPSQPQMGPNPELTPEPSPRSPSPQNLPEPRERRRFAPQLIETSRRSRRVGDFGPATRPTDKTDITPYTNHIYSAKPKSNRRPLGLASGEDDVIRPNPPTRRETEEEGVKEYLLELAAKEAARQMEEAALAAFPNSRPREGGVAHFYFRDSSDGEESPQGTPENEESGQQRFRRKSSNLGLNWWHKHMQEHAKQLVQDKGEGDEEAVVVVEDDGDFIMRSDSDLDRMELPSPPDPMWTTTKPLDATTDRRDSLADLQLALAEANRHSATQAHGKLAAASASAAPVPESVPNQPHTGLSHMPLEPGRQEPNPFGRPFGAFCLPPQDPRLLKLRQAASPPMLGKDLIFRKCPSPKFTQLETDHPRETHMIEDHHRDLSGQAGLWRGYCCRSESTGDCIVPSDLRNPRMIETPIVPDTPHNICSCELDGTTLSEEPVSIWSSSGSSKGVSEHGLWSADTRTRDTEPKGMHMLHGLNERLQREKAQAERKEKIMAEFDEEFVTQVYNYLSLGYPAMARGFDDELSRISHIDVEDLRRQDEMQMAKGHMLEMKLDETPEDGRCPRWLALRTYITEWARQHPDLENLDPLAWGVRERRGSWAI